MTTIKIFLQLSLTPPYTKLKLGKNSSYARLTLFVEWREGLGLCDLENSQKYWSVPRLLSMIVVSMRGSPILRKPRCVRNFGIIPPISFFFDLNLRPSLSIKTQIYYHIIQISIECTSQKSWEMPRQMFSICPYAENRLKCNLVPRVFLFSTGGDILENKKTLGTRLDWRIPNWI